MRCISSMPRVVHPPMVQRRLRCSRTRLQRARPSVDTRRRMEERGSGWKHDRVLGTGRRRNTDDVAKILSAHLVDAPPSSTSFSMRRSSRTASPSHHCWRPSAPRALACRCTCSTSRSPPACSRSSGTCPHALPHSIPSGVAPGTLEQHLADTTLPLALVLTASRHMRQGGYTPSPSQRGGVAHMHATCLRGRSAVGACLRLPCPTRLCEHVVPCVTLTMPSLLSCFVRPGTCIS